MEVTGTNVLIETTLTKTDKKVILLGEADKSGGYDAKSIIKSVGSKITDKVIVVGAEPIFAHYAEPLHSEIISGKKGEDVIVQISIMSEGHIIGIR